MNTPSHDFPSAGIPAHHPISEHQPWPCKEPSKDIPAVTGIPPRLMRRRDKTIPLAPPPCAPIYSGSVLQNFQQALAEVDLEFCAENGENAFYVCDLAEVYRQAVRWKRVMGERVHPFYAVKCNPDPHVLRLLAAFGTGFDCASHAEIATVLSLGVDPSRIIYANPCKAASFIRHAYSTGIRMMTFDNADELVKVARFHPTARLVLRILTDDSGSLCRFGDKFGAPQRQVRPLLVKAKELGLDVMGISFHVGSGCSNPNLYVDAIRHARAAFQIASELGMNFELLDIGGGFGHENFETLADAVILGLDMYFPKDFGVRVIAEPGRYFVSEAYELATNIIARRANREDDSHIGMNKDQTDSDTVESDSPKTLYYVNDGVYGAFNCIMFDHQVVQPQVLTLGGEFQGYATSKAPSPPADFSEAGLLTPIPSSPGLEYPDPMLFISESHHSIIKAPPSTPCTSSNMLGSCKIFGPSCDSIDLICSDALLPIYRLDVGDWLRWRGMGAYTICAASQFNGFKLSQVRYTIDEEGEMGVEQIVRGLVMSNGAPTTTTTPATSIL